MSNTNIPTVLTAAEAKDDYRDMLVRLMTRQLYAETATAEIFGRSISVAPTWREKHLAAEFAYEEAQHSQMLCDLLSDLGENPERLIANRPPAASFWRVDLDNWLNIAVFNFTVDRAGSQQIMEYRDSSYLPWAKKMVVVLEDEEEHYENGVDNLREFSSVPEQLANFQAVYNDMLPVTLKRAFGRPDGFDNEFCLRTGLKRHSTEDVINRYLIEMRSYMDPVGLKFPPLKCFDTENVEVLSSTRQILASLQ